MPTIICMRENCYVLYRLNILKIYEKMEKNQVELLELFFTQNNYFLGVLN